MSTSWTEAAVNIIEYTAQRNTTFTADDVRRTADEFRMEEPWHANSWGAAWRTAARRKLIASTQWFQPSTYPLSRGRQVRVWMRAA